MFIDQNQVSCDVEDQKGWWAVYTKHQHEKRIADLMSKREIEVFLPLYESVRHWGDRDVKLSLPLFPSYVFVREQPELHLTILSTPGVHMIVSSGPKYAVISAWEIRNLQKALQADRHIERHPFVRVGERVRITRGVLEGVEGILLRQKNLYRVVLAVDMLAQAAAVEVNAWEIGPVNRGSCGTRLAQGGSSRRASFSTSIAG